MIIKIRNEKWGYTIFRHEDRKYFFIETSLNLKNISNSDLQKFLSIYFKDFIIKRDEVQFIGVEKVNSSSLDLVAPIGMYLEITRNCNLMCGHCYKPDTINSFLMSVEQIKELIDEMVDMGVMEIRLCGNEPTYSNHFISVVEYILKKGLYIGINTNAVMSAKKKEEFLNLKPNLVVVSIDGDMQTHNMLRGKGVYEKAVKLIREFKERGVECRINTVLSKMTIDKIFDVVVLANELHCGVSFLPFRPIGRDKVFNTVNAIDSKQMRKAVEDITRARKNYPDIILYTYFDVLGDGEAKYHHPIDKFNIPCPARKNGFITYSGDFFPCDFLRWAGKKFYCGNILLKGGFERIWEKSKTMKYFQSLKHEKCKRCGFYMKKCYGGCICNAIASGNTSDDVLCFINI